jgi:prevent-host-death family protein
MKTATLRQLRNETATLAKWVQAGETVLVTKRSKPLFRLLPALPTDSGVSRIPDFEARQRDIFPEGSLSISGAELIAGERDRY